ncbi:MAG: hypothetical protein H0W68_01340 [Gemmatimonadaceae bacterium]|nr:hypothetical protein [Gemmatimonadaceae bacterium]
MPHREFRDALGERWEVWEAYPTLGERRSGRERRAAVRDHEDRRQVVSSMSTVARAQYGGWLVFQSRGERRRLVPAGDDVERMWEEELRGLLSQASPVGRPTRAKV